MEVNQMNPRLFRHVEAPNQPDRPSHFREDQNERDIVPSPDYPTEMEESVDLGFLPAANPVPVYLVEPPPADRTLRQWSTGQMTLTGSGQELSGADRRRTRMVVVNNDTDATVLLSRKKDDIAALCYPIAPGKDVELLHNDSVYARATGGDASAPIGWIVEFEIEA